MTPFKVHNLFQITLPVIHKLFAERELESKNRHVKRIIASRIFPPRSLTGSGALSVTLSVNVVDTPG